MAGTVALMLALVACKPEETEEQSPGVMATDLVEGVGSAVFGGIQQAPGRALVLHVNAVGAAVAGAGTTLSVGGVSTPVTFDATGYGQLALATAGSAEVTGGVAPAWIHAVANDWPGFGLLGGEIARTPGIYAAPAHLGYLVGSATEVWWVGPGEISHSVLKPDAPIGGLRAVHLDLDGVVDALVWAGDTVYFLKGRSTGGLSFGAAVRAEGYAAIGADAADLDGDDLPDIAIAWDGQAGEDHVQTLLGDGMWGYESRPPKVLLTPPEVLSIGDNTGDGVQQVTVIRHGEWSRYQWSTGGNLIETGPTLTGSFMETDWIDGSHDINNDGGAEIAMVGPLVPDLPREVKIYDLLGTTIQVLPLQPPEGHLAFAEVDGNGVDDLLMSYADGEGVAVTNAGGDWVQKTIGTLGEHGPIAATDVNLDGHPDVFVAGTKSWRTFDGALIDDSDGSKRFVIDPPALGSTGLPASTLLASAEVDGNAATSEIVGIQTGTTSTSVVVWSVGTALTPLRTITLPGGASAGVDLAVCGTMAYALTSTDVHVVDLATGTRTGGQAIAGSKVACGTGPSASVAAVLVPDSVALLDASGATIGTAPAVGGKDVALVDIGAGPEAATCTVDGCVALAWRFSTTEMAFVWTDATSLHAERASGDTVMPFVGVPSIQDVDGDGIADLVAAQAGADTSAVAVWRGTGVFWGPGEVFHLPAVIGAVAAVGDVDGDGARDLFAPRLTDSTVIVSGPR